MPLSVIQGILISFAGTSLGARWPSCSRGQISRHAQRSLTHSLTHSLTGYPVLCLWSVTVKVLPCSGSLTSSTTPLARSTA